MGAATATVLPNIGVHARLDTMMDYFEEIERSWMPWSSSTSMASHESTNAFSSCSSPRHPRTLFLTMEEAMIETKIKGNLLSRIHHLEEHVVKLEAVINKKKVVQEDIKQRKGKRYHDARRKDNTCLEIAQHRRKLHGRGRRPTPINNIKENTDKAKQKSLFQKILHAGAIHKPFKGFNFLLGSSKDTPVEEEPHCQRTSDRRVMRKEEHVRHKNLKIKRKEEEESMKKAVLPMVNMSKLKSHDNLEINRVFSLQGIQTCTPLEMKHGR